MRLLKENPKDVCVEDAKAAKKRIRLQAGAAVDKKVTEA
jgi:hypothetical protein